MKEIFGTVIDITDKGLDFPTIVTVEYVVENKKYLIKEYLKLKSKMI